MDNMPERERPKPERVIKLGEEFYPFDPKYTDDKTYSPPTGEFRLVESSIQLNLGGMNLPFRVHVNNYGDPVFRSWGLCITPFDPELGYQIDSDDLTITTRKQKLKRLEHKLLNPIDSEKAGYLLHFEAPRGELNKIGINRKTGNSEYEFPEETKDLLSKLRVHVLFPNLSFEGNARTSIENGGINFSEFNPIDMVPLAEAEYEIPGDETMFMMNGLFIALPSDPEKLTQIRARFVMAQDQPKES